MHVLKKKAGTVKSPCLFLFGISGISDSGIWIENFRIVFIDMIAGWT
jgi:hypothetical protein